VNVIAETMRRVSLLVVQEGAESPGSKRALKGGGEAS
jgi:hypothetical protein